MQLSGGWLASWPPPLSATFHLIRQIFLVWLNTEHVHGSPAHMPPQSGCKSTPARVTRYPGPGWCGQGGRGGGAGRGGGGGAGARGDPNFEQLH